MPPLGFRFDNRKPNGFLSTRISPRGHAAGRQNRNRVWEIRSIRGLADVPHILHPGRAHQELFVGDAIRVEGLVKRYGEVVAVDGLDLAVPQGTVMALLGPNGAGKTTTVRILTTLLEPDEGRAEVAGLDVRTEGKALRSIIGLSGQYAAVDENLTGFENLDMVGRLYHMGKQASRERARQLLQQLRSRRGRRPPG